RLVTVLDQFASPDYPVYAVVPQRRFLPARVRHFIEHLRQTYTAPAYWD
ncbi:MAG: LysR family transcriptional regulator, partial [Aquitalea sp.]|nr:LysR family transcriptional regulator [Aquitalea sp.]